MPQGYAIRKSTNQLDLRRQGNDILSIRPRIYDTIAKDLDTMRKIKDP